MWLVILRQEGRPPKVCANSLQRDERPPGMRGLHTLGSKAMAEAYAKDMTKLFRRLPGLTYTAEQWPSLKAAKAAGYTFAEELPA